MFFVMLWTLHILDEVGTAHKLLFSFYVSLGKGFLSFFSFFLCRSLLSSQYLHEHQVFQLRTERFITSPPPTAGMEGHFGSFKFKPQHVGFCFNDSLLELASASFKNCLFLVNQLGWPVFCFVLFYLLICLLVKIWPKVMTHWDGMQGTRCLVLINLKLSGLKRGTPPTFTSVTFQSAFLALWRKVKKGNYGGGEFGVWDKGGVKLRALIIL